MVLAVTACGGTRHSSSQVAPGGGKGKAGTSKSVALESVDTCTLLTDQQVRAVLVQPVDNKRPLGSIGIASCAIQATPVDPQEIFGNYLDVVVQKPLNGAVAQCAYLSKGNPIIEGLGDKAFYESDRSSVTVEIPHEDVIVGVSMQYFVSKDRPADLTPIVEKLRTAGGQVLERL